MKPELEIPNDVRIAALKEHRRVLVDQLVVFEAKAKFLERERLKEKTARVDPMLAQTQGEVKYRTKFIVMLDEMIEELEK